jgi:hypothetical protein
MQVPVRYHGQMLARSALGEALPTTYVAFDDAAFFVRSVRFASSTDGGPGACTCVCDLSTTLADDRSAEHIAAALIDQLRNTHKKQRK